MVVNLPPALEQVWHAHPVIIKIWTLGICVVGIALVDLAREGEDDVVGIEVACRDETVDGVKADPTPQVEDVI